MHPRISDTAAVHPCVCVLVLIPGHHSRACPSAARSTSLSPFACRCLPPQAASPCAATRRPPSWSPTRAQRTKALARPTCCLPLPSSLFNHVSLLPLRRGSGGICFWRKCWAPASMHRPLLHCCFHSGFLCYLASLRCFYVCVPINQAQPLVGKGLWGNFSSPLADTLTCNLRLCFSTPFSAVCSLQTPSPIYYIHIHTHCAATHPQTGPTNPKRVPAALGAGLPLLICADSQTHICANGTSPANPLRLQTDK